MYDSMEYMILNYVMLSFGFVC